MTEPSPEQRPSVWGGKVRIVTNVTDEKRVGDRRCDSPTGCGGWCAHVTRGRSLWWGWRCCCWVSWEEGPDWWRGWAAGSDWTSSGGSRFLGCRLAAGGRTEKTVREFKRVQRLRNQYQWLICVSLTGRISKVCRAPVFRVMVSLSLMAAAVESDANVGTRKDPQSGMNKNIPEIFDYTSVNESHPGVWSAGGSVRGSGEQPQSWGRGYSLRSPPIVWNGSEARRMKDFLDRMRSARTPLAPGDPLRGLRKHTGLHLTPYIPLKALIWKI